MLPHLQFEPDRLMSLGSCLHPFPRCASPGNRQGGSEVRAFLSWLANERKVSVSTASSGHWRPCCSSTAKCCAGSALASRIGRPRPSRRLPVVLTPDEVVRILGFLEGRASFVRQLLYGTGMRIGEGFATAGQDLDFDHGTSSSCGENRAQDRALMLPGKQHPACASSCRDARAWWLDRIGRGRSGVAASGHERKYPPGHSLAVVLGFAQHAFDRSPGSGRCVAIMYDQTFPARLPNVPA